MKLIEDLTVVVCFLLGLATITLGVALVSLPAALILGGTFGVVAAVLYTWNRPRGGDDA